MICNNNIFLKQQKTKIYKNISCRHAAVNLPNPVDIYVGQRIKLRREALGLSQEKLAYFLGITFQQVQKYEQAKNRVCASRLFDISKILETGIQFFYDDMPPEIAEQSPRMFYLPADFS